MNQQSNDINVVRETNKSNQRVAKIGALATVIAAIIAALVVYFKKDEPENTPKISNKPDISLKNNIGNNSNSPISGYVEKQENNYYGSDKSEKKSQTEGEKKQQSPKGVIIYNNGNNQGQQVIGSEVHGDINYYSTPKPEKNTLYRGDQRFASVKNITFSDDKKFFEIESLSFFNMNYVQYIEDTLKYENYILKIESVGKNSLVPSEAVRITGRVIKY